MGLTPLEIQKMQFPQRMRGYDPNEVDGFLSLVAEELTLRLKQLERLEREVAYTRHRLEQAEEREHQLQQTLVRAQKVAEEISTSARREAELMIREAQGTADRIVQQAVDQATTVESRIGELRTRRRELQIKLKSTIDLFEQILQADMEEDRTTATVHTLPRIPRQGVE